MHTPLRQVRVQVEITKPLPSDRLNAFAYEQRKWLLLITKLRELESLGSTWPIIEGSSNSRVIAYFQGFSTPCSPSSQAWGKGVNVHPSTTSPDKELSNR